MRNRPIVTYSPWTTPTPSKNEAVIISGKSRWSKPGAEGLLLTMVERVTRSPIKDLPVRQAGQSLREKLDDLASGPLAFWLLFAGLMLLYAAHEWWQYLSKTPPRPILTTVVALVACLAAFFRIRKFVRQARDIRLGRTGEEAVGQYLDETLRPLGCQVLHDIPADGFNLDHVVIGPTGVFYIETKTRSKPMDHDAHVRYDGEKVTVDGFVPDRDPVVQARAFARWLSDLIERTAGCKFPVRPVVLFPGWYVEKMPENTEVWVLNEKALPKFIRNARGNLAPDDVTLVTFHLKRYVIVETERKK